MPTSLAPSACPATNRCPRRHKIMFSGAMMQALLSGHKTETRRTMNLQPTARDVVSLDGPEYRGCVVARWPGESEFDGYDCHCPYGKVGTRLWVQEDWLPGIMKTIYRADYVGVPDPFPGQWRLARWMAKERSRVTLEIVGVRAEPLHEIDELGALAEGVEGERLVTGTIQEAGKAARSGEFVDGSARDGYAQLWDQLNGRGRNRWANNPWVWVLSFRVHPHPRVRRMPTRLAVPS